MALCVVAVLCTPFWYSDLVLAGRFEVGVGGGGKKLVGPLAVLEYLGHVAGDFTAGFTIALGAVLILAAIGAWRLWVENRTGAILTACVLVVPLLALTLADLGDSTSPESRHLVFALPFFACLVALGLIEAARGTAVRPRRGDLRAARRRGRLGLGQDAAALRGRAFGADRGPPRGIRPGSRPAHAPTTSSSATSRSTSAPGSGTAPVSRRRSCPGRTRTSPSRFCARRRRSDEASGSSTRATRTTSRRAWRSRCASRRGSTVSRRACSAPSSSFAAGSPPARRRCSSNRREPRELVGKSLYIGDADINLVTVDRAIARLDRD